MSHPIHDGYGLWQLGAEAALSSQLAVIVGAFASVFLLLYGWQRFSVVFLMALAILGWFIGISLGARLALEGPPLQLAGLVASALTPIGLSRAWIRKLFEMLLVPAIWGAFMLSVNTWVFGSADPLPFFGVGAAGGLIALSAARDFSLLTSLSLLGSFAAIHLVPAALGIDPITDSLSGKSGNMVIALTLLALMMVSMYLQLKVAKPRGMKL